jgi:hypothetical protein
MSNDATVYADVPAAFLANVRDDGTRTLNSFEGPLRDRVVRQVSAFVEDRHTMKVATADVVALVREFDTLEADNSTLSALQLANIARACHAFADNDRATLFAGSRRTMGKLAVDLTGDNRKPIATHPGVGFLMSVYTVMIDTTNDIKVDASMEEIAEAIKSNEDQEARLTLMSMALIHIVFSVTSVLRTRGFFKVGDRVDSIGGIGTLELERDDLLFTPSQELMTFAESVDAVADFAALIFSMAIFDAVFGEPGATTFGGRASSSVDLSQSPLRDVINAVFVRQARSPAQIQALSAEICGNVMQESPAMWAWATMVVGPFLAPVDAL